MDLARQHAADRVYRCMTGCSGRSPNSRPIAVVFAACGSGGGPPVIDAGPSLTIQVSPLGDDSADGIARPVETLRRAIGIATEDHRVNAIELAAGTKDTRDRQAHADAQPRQRPA